MCLHVSIKLPPELDERIRRSVADLGADAAETYLLELYRRGVLDHVELSTALGLDRFQTSALLHERKIYEGSLTMEDMEQDRRAIEHYMREHRI